jgi:hypothetical protein
LQSEARQEGVYPGGGPAPDRQWDSSRAHVDTLTGTQLDTSASVWAPDCDPTAYNEDCCFALLNINSPPGAAHGGNGLGR